MNIAIDWDNTFTRDQKFFQKMLEVLHNDFDHKVYIVTSRGKDTPIEYIPEFIEDVIYCDFKAKKYVTDLHGIDIAIWIDDDPLYITKGWVE